MSLRLEMTQVARLAPNLLLESTGLVQSFIQSRHQKDGLFLDRADTPDLYYTSFGLQCLEAMQMNIPSAALAHSLITAGIPDDLVSAATLARCWSFANETPSPETLDQIMKIEESCRRDFLYAPSPESSAPTVYACFLAVGMLQDLKAPLPDLKPLCQSLEKLLNDDGGFPNEAAIPLSTTPSTAAAVALHRQAGLEPPASSLKWLLHRFSPDGGAYAADGAPMPDLLSTAVALHALSASNAPLAPLREPTLDYLDSLWTNTGGFYGNWSDSDLDVEYTYYGLLSLGHLSLL